MSVAVRPVDLPAQRQELLDILSRNLTAVTHAARFDWLYLLNPAGRARAWFAYDPQTGKNVGAASLFPRHVWLDGKPALCGQVGDFAIEKAHRSLGPALALQRATFEPVDRGDLAFCYDCPPHEQGMSTFRRLGMEPNSHMLRFVRLLRADRLLARLLGRGPWTSAGAALANLVLRSRSKRRLPGLETRVLHGLFGSEFSELDRRVAMASGGIRCRRQADDLNWRFRSDPLNRYEVLTAHLHGELLAFLVGHFSGEDAGVVDLFGERLEQAGPVLLDAFTGLAAVRCAQTLEAGVAAADPLAEVLRRANFRYRSMGARVVAYAPPASPVMSLLGQDSRWLFQQVDVMV